MRRAARQASRFAAIDKRVRARRIAGWRSTQRFARESECEHQRRMTMLAALTGKIEAGTFSQSEVCEARAALLQGDPTSPQGALRLRETRHA